MRLSLVKEGSLIYKSINGTEGRVQYFLEHLDYLDRSGVCLILTWCVPSFMMLVKKLPVLNLDLF